MVVHTFCQIISHFHSYLVFRTWDKQISFSDCKKVGAFAGDLKTAEEVDNGEYLIPDVPFVSLLQQSVTIDNVITFSDKKVLQDNQKQNSDVNNSNNNNVINNNNVRANVDDNLVNPSNGDSDSNDGDNDLHKSSSSCASGPGDFVLVDLVFVF